MPRIRTIKPEFWNSPDTASASAVARLLYIALWNWSDDAGRGEADLKAIEGFAFPNDDVSELSGGTSDNFRDVMTEVVECFGLNLYIVSGRPFYEIPSWSNHQRNERVAKSRYPSPTEGLTCTVDEICGKRRKFRRTVSEAPQTSGPGTGEQGNRGTGEQGLKDSFNAAVATVEPEVQKEPSNPYPADFLRFYDTYPRHQKKGDALKAFRKAKNRATVQEIVDGAQRLRDDPNREDQYTPLPASWLNADGWEDEPLPARNVPATVTQFAPRRTATDKAQSILSMTEQAKRIRGEA